MDEDELYLCSACDDAMSEDDFLRLGGICEDCQEAVQRAYEYEDDDIPAGCLACGGPYPACKSSCPMFDD